MLHNPDKKVDVVAEESNQIKEPTHVSSQPKIEEVEQVLGKREQDASLKKSIVITEEKETIMGSPTLLAWCSQLDNKIDIVDLSTKRSYASFDGVELSDTRYSWTHVKEIPNTKLLVSLHHNSDKSANMSVFDISEKDQIKEIYSLGEVSGERTGNGDITYNSRRGILGAVPLYRKFSYYLFNVGSYASNTKDIVKLTRKSTWHSQHTSVITGLDFNPTGEYMASIDSGGVCLISDVTTANYRFHVTLGDWDRFARCRWSTNADESLIFVKYDSKNLNILDSEKKTLTLKSSVELDDWVKTYWIDVCQNDGNLLVIGGVWNIEVFDKRVSKIIKTCDGVDSGPINCVRWSPSGDKLASASRDGVSLLDFKTGKVLYTVNTEKSKLSLPKYMIVIQKSYSLDLFSVFHLDNHETKWIQRTRITLKNVSQAAQFR